MTRIDPAALKELEAGPVRGKIVRVEGPEDDRVVRLIPWNQATRQARSGEPISDENPNRTIVESAGPVPQWMIEQSERELPPIVRIPHRERFKMLCRTLLADAMRSYQITGVIMWPESVQRELREMGWKEGNPDLQGQVEALASRYIVEAANKQKEQDLKKVALDYPGHLSA